MVNLKNVNYSYNNNTKVLTDISFSAVENECIGLIGANGAGKSTLLKTIVGLTDNYQGEIHVCSLILNKKNLNKIREHIGYVFQDSDSQLFMSNVYDDVAFAPRNFGFSKERTDEAVRKALESVNALHLIDRKTYRLSGGEKKLVALATVLSITPDIILLDEPTVALDPKNRRNFINLIRTLPQLRIIASHDLDMVYDTCDRVILINEGRIVADKPAMEILTDKTLLEENGLELPLRFYSENP
ncbi:MAG: energy-coupling factor ABC transporter ATP-binding protein [Lachnospira sp.]